MQQGVLNAVQPLNNKWTYKIPYACQWIWPLPIILGALFAPESPWWLVRQGRIPEAKKALLRLTSQTGNPNFHADETIAMIERTNDYERRITAGTSYADCFKAANLRRTEIACMVWAIQILCGSTLMGYSTYFYEQAGLASASAFTMTLIQYALGAIGTVISWFLMNWFGRRTLYMTGQAVQAVLLVIIGGLGCVSNSGSSVHWAIGSLLLVYVLCYDATIGPVCYALVAELSSTRLRVKTVVLARNMYNITGLVNNILTPRMLNPSAWDWGAKAGFFWAGSCFLCLVWTYLRLPEPKGRTDAELDFLFERGVSARGFASAVVDVFQPRDELAVFEKKGVSGTVVTIETVG